MAAKKIQRTKEEIESINKKIAQKIDKIREIFINEELADEYDHLIKRIAFLAVNSQELEKALIEKGFVEEYQHGENQWGTKESVESAVYFKTIKSLNTITKQFRDILIAEDTLDKTTEEIEEQLEILTYE